MAVSGVRSSCETFATKSRRIDLEPPQLGHVVQHEHEAERPRRRLPRRRAAFTCSVSPVPVPAPSVHVARRDTRPCRQLAHQLAERRIARQLDQRAAARATRRSPDRAARGRGRSAATTVPARSVTSTPSTMPRRIASRRSRSTRERPRSCRRPGAPSPPRRPSSSAEVVRSLRRQVRGRLVRRQLAREDAPAAVRGSASAVASARTTATARLPPRTRPAARCRRSEAAPPPDHSSDAVASDTRRERRQRRRQTLDERPTRRARRD